MNLNVIREQIFNHCIALIKKTLYSIPSLLLYMDRIPFVKIMTSTMNPNSGYKEWKTQYLLHILDIKCSSGSLKFTVQNKKLSCPGHLFGVTIPHQHSHNVAGF